MLIAAIILSAIVAITAGIVATQSLKTADISMLPRIRSNMAQAELQVKNLVLNPASYVGCTTANAATCALQAGIFAPLETNGIAINLAYSNLKVTGDIRYVPPVTASQNRKFVIQPRLIDIQIPAEILQTTATFQCPTNGPNPTPIFVGFDKITGEKICKGVPNNRCPEGFVTKINRNTLAPECEPINGQVSCDILQMIGSITWSGGASFTGNCVGRLPPPINPVYN